MLKLKAQDKQFMEIAQFKDLDYYAVEKYRLPIELMMENAGLQLANVVAMNCKLTDKILIGIGNGNNGGGGLVAARRLSAWGFDVSLDVWGEISKSLPLSQFERAVAFGVQSGRIEAPDVWVDAYLGFSQRLPLPSALNNRIQQAQAFSGLCVSLDIPLGFDINDTKSSFPADIIVTLAAPKSEFEVLRKARVYVADLGIPAEVYAKFGKEILPFAGNNIIQLKQDVYTNEHVLITKECHRSSFLGLKRGQIMGAYLVEYADELAEAFQSRENSIVVEISNYYKPLMGSSAEEIFKADLGQKDFLEIAASVHGFRSITEVENVEIDVDFEKAVDALLEGDYLGLKEILQNNPSLVNQRSQFGHKAQLIHYCSSNAVEIYRQVVPLNLDVMLQLLLNFGADPSKKIPVYGGEFDFYELFTSSAHPYDAGINKNIEALFKS